METDQDQVLPARIRGIYVSKVQKRKLLKILSANKEILRTKGRGPGYETAIKVWKSVANQCNALPGARKTWQQWRKSFQDMKSKTRKLNSYGELPAEVQILDADEQDVLGVNEADSHANETEFIPLAEHPEANDQPHSDTDNHKDNELDDEAPSSPAERKVFDNRPKEKPHKKKHSKFSRNYVPLYPEVGAPDHSTDCALNCKVLADQEEKKIRLKREYFIMKKQYLSEKIKLMKEQTEALKSIAKSFASEENGTQ